MEQSDLFTTTIGEAIGKLDAYRSKSQENEYNFKASFDRLTASGCSHQYAILELSTNLKNSYEQVNDYLFFIKNSKKLHLTETDLSKIEYNIRLIMLTEKKMSIKGYLDFLVSKGVLDPANKSKIHKEISESLITDPRQLDMAKASFQQILKWIRTLDLDRDFEKLPVNLREIFSELFVKILYNKIDYAFEAKGILNFLNRNIEPVKSISMPAYAKLRSILNSYEQNLANPARTACSKEPELD